MSKRVASRKCGNAAAARLIERKSVSARRRVGGKERKELMQHVGITSTSRGFTLTRSPMRSLYEYVNLSAVDLWRAAG